MNIFHFLIPFFHQYGYVILFFGSFLEGLPLIGVIVPGATLAVFGGFLARTHTLHFSIVFIVLMMGAYLGDVLNYFLGRFFGYKFLKKYGKYFFLTEERLEFVRSQIKNHQGKTLILGRFTAFTRSLSPFAAGASNVEISSFLTLTLISAVLWSFAHAAIGFIFGRWLEKIIKHLGLIFVIAIIIGILAVYTYRFVNARHHIFKKYQIYSLVVMLLSLFVFTSALNEVTENEWLVFINHYIANLASNLQSDWLTPIMIGITNIGNVFYLSIFTAALALYLISQKRKYLAALTLFSLLLGEFLQFFLKEIISIPRPPTPLVHTFLSAYPSGHATAAMILGSFLFLTFSPKIKNTIGKVLFVSLILIGVLLIGFSRIYLNVHWASDIIGGFSLGLFTVSFSILFFQVLLFVRKWFGHGNNSRRKIN